MRLSCKQFNLEEPPPRIPLLCIEIIRDDRLREIQERCDGYIADGVAEVWLLDADFKRAYTVNQSGGLREFEGKGRVELVDLNGHAVGRGTFEPGWRWSDNVKPVAGTDSCQVDHIGYVLEGRMALQMDDDYRIICTTVIAFTMSQANDYVGG